MNNAKSQRNSSWTQTNTYVRMFYTCH